MVPVAHVWVTLHRVGPDTAGPLDSTRAGADGRYAFTYHRTGSNEAVYFASATYDGIAYFSQPLTQALDTGEAAEITVFDTTSHPVPLHVRGRHLIVSAPGVSQLRQVVEVFELSNDTSVTMIATAAAGESDRPTWTSILPNGARDFRAGQGDVPPDAMTMASGRAQVFTPFAPGLKQVTYAYGLPASAFPLRLPLGAETSVFEVLLEEPSARAEVPGLREVDPTVVSGRNFRRFLAHDVPASAVASVTVPSRIGNARALYIAVVLAACGLGMLGALAYASTRGVRVHP